MKINRIIAAIAGIVCALSGCDGFNSVDVYTVAVDPYVPANESDLRIGECTISFGEEVSVNGAGAWYKDNNIVINKGGVYKISGSYSGGCIDVTADDPVKLVFENAEISNADGFAVNSGSGKLIISAEGMSSITGCGGSNNNAVYSKGETLIVGSGSLVIDGGIFSGKCINFGRNVSTICEMLHTDDGYMIPGKLLIN